MVEDNEEANPNGNAWTEPVTPLVVEEEDDPKKNSLMPPPPYLEGAKNTVTKEKPPSSRTDKVSSFISSTPCLRRRIR